MATLETRVEEESQGVFSRLYRNKYARKIVLPVTAALSVLSGTERVGSQSLNPLAHDPVLLVHGLDIDFKDTNDEYCDFNGDRTVGFGDFVQFGKRFGSRIGDVKYDEGLDIDRNGEIGFGDFVIFNKSFGKTTKPLESTWDELSEALVNDLDWKDGGTVGRWVSTSNLKDSDFYKLRLSSGNKLTFNQQGEEVKFAVEQISKVTGKNVILAGFSMGGLSARAYLQNNSDPKTSALVTICTPHVGSYLAYLPEEKLKISDWKSRFKDKPWVAPLADVFLAYASAASQDKPAIKYLAPGSDSLRILNNNIHRMPTNIPFVNVVSQVPNQEILDFGLELINKYLLDYNRYKQAASQGLLSKGDGVVPAISQLLSYAIVNTNAQNIQWYEQARNNITENSEMQVSHLDGNKQVSVLEEVLLGVIERIKPLDELPPEKMLLAPAGTKHELILIPKGEFTMGLQSGFVDDKNVWSYEYPAHKAHLDDYYIDMYEVTNDKFVAFLNHLGRITDNNGNKFIAEESLFNRRYQRIKQIDGKYVIVKPEYFESDLGSHPAILVTWYGANAYCQWAGMRLPTQAEWEKAARGTDGKIYPWGNFYGLNANGEDNFYNPFYDTTPVGLFDGKTKYAGPSTKLSGNYPFGNGRSPYGLYDMAGNVWEWCEDWFSEDYYSSSAYKNPKGPEMGDKKVLKGGGWIYPGGPDYPNQRTTFRMGKDPLNIGGLDYGFRCVEDVK